MACPPSAGRAVVEAGPSGSPKFRSVSHDPACLTTRLQGCDDLIEVDLGRRPTAAGDPLPECGFEFIKAHGMPRDYLKNGTDHLAFTADLEAAFGRLDQFGRSPKEGHSALQPLVIGVLHPGFSRRATRDIDVNRIGSNLFEGKRQTA
jgi:hypothetical protein